MALVLRMLQCASPAYGVTWVIWAATVLASKPAAPGHLETDGGLPRRPGLSYAWDRRSGQENPNLKVTLHDWGCAIQAAWASKRLVLLRRDSWAC